MAARACGSRIGPSNSVLFVCLGGGEPVVHVQKLESMAPEFQSITEVMQQTPTIVTSESGTGTNKNSAAPGGCCLNSCLNSSLASCQQQILLSNI